MIASCHDPEHACSRNSESQWDVGAPQWFFLSSTLIGQVAWACDGSCHHMSRPWESGAGRPLPETRACDGSRDHTSQPQEMMGRGPIDVRGMATATPKLGGSQRR